MYAKNQICTCPIYHTKRAVLIRPLRRRPYSLTTVMMSWNLGWQDRQWHCFNSSPAGPNGRHFADDIFRCILLNEKFCILFRISPKLFLRCQLTISQHWFREWLGAEQATNHYLNQCWLSLLMHICGTKGRWVKTGVNGDAVGTPLRRCTYFVRL